MDYDRMDTLDLMVEIKKRLPNMGVEISIHPHVDSLYPCYIGASKSYEMVYPRTLGGVRAFLINRLKKLGSRGLLFKKF